MHMHARAPVCLVECEEETEMRHLENASGVNVHLLGCLEVRGARDI